MNIKNIIILNLVLICVLFINLNAELLILKQTGSGFEPLSQADIDKDGDAISKIILKYQWPMCIISKLSKEEQEEVGSNLPNAEEIFIEKKLREISDDYRVVFIPTVLYELFFLLCDIEKPTDRDSIKKICQLFSDYTLRFDDAALENSINDYKSKTNNKPLPEQLNDIYSWYKIFNNNFFDIDDLNFKKPELMPDFNITPHMLLNQKIVKFLFSSVYVESKKSLDFSNIIEQRSTGLLFTEIQNRFNAVQLYNNSMAGKSFYVTEILTKIIDAATGDIKITESLKRMIVLEYEARKLNRGILIRGTSPILVDVEVEDAQKDIDVPAKTIFKKIKSKIIAMATSFYASGLYSISFGNSMFAGIFQDPGACTYSYLSDSKKFGSKKFGYSVFIDKQKYFNHKLFNLFFISPLSTIAGMLARGEFFHSRTKVPGANKSLLSTFYHSYSIKGLIVPLKTINGIILINQKTLDYEKIFAKFVSENGRIIQIGANGFGVSSGLLPYEVVLQAQEEKFKESQILLARSSAAKIVQTEDFKKKQLGIVVGKFIKKLREKRDENQKNLINLTTSLAVLRRFKL